MTMNVTTTTHPWYTNHPILVGSVLVKRKVFLYWSLSHCRCHDSRTARLSNIYPSLFSKLKVFVRECDVLSNIIIEKNSSTSLQHSVTSNGTLTQMEYFFLENLTESFQSHINRKVVYPDTLWKC